MKIAISNLAWEKSDDEKILPILKKYKIKGIELAVTKCWTSPTEIDKKDILKYKNYWSENGIEIVATTSLLFGHPELTIFNDSKLRMQTFKYLSQMIHISSLLGAKVMVFGSPKNRITGNLPKDEVNSIAKSFFYKIGEVAEKYSLFFGIEANPTLYGTDFINSTEEAIQLVKNVNHPNFRLHLDTSTMAINKESYESTLKKGLEYSKHLHISEPGLKTIPQKDGTDHKEVAKILHNLKYNNWASIEMPLNNETPKKLDLIDDVLKFVTNVYV